MYTPSHFRPLRSTAQEIHSVNRFFPVKFSAEHLVHDVSAMPDPIPGTVCPISIIASVILLIFIFYLILTI